MARPNSHFLLDCSQHELSNRGSCPRTLGAKPAFRGRGGLRWRAGCFDGTGIREQSVMVLWIRSIVAVVAGLVSAFVVVAVGQGSGPCDFSRPGGRRPVQPRSHQGDHEPGGNPERWVPWFLSWRPGRSQLWPAGGLRHGRRLERNSPPRSFLEPSSWPQRSPSFSTCPIRSGCGSPESS